jgi:hypothetical protein
MTTAKFAGRGGVMMMTAPHATGHAWAKYGTLLRFDCERGHGWVATHYDLRLGDPDPAGVLTMPGQARTSDSGTSTQRRPGRRH